MARRARGSVVLFKERNQEGDEYERLLHAAGWTALFCPVLSFEPCNVEGLVECLLAQDELFCILLTSPRAAAALRAATRSVGLSVPVYCVGSATAAPIRAECERADVRGEGSGCADVLKEQLIADWERAGRRGSVLFLCGTQRLDTLPDALRRAGVPFRELTVYRSCDAVELRVRATGEAPTDGADAQACAAADAAAPPPRGDVSAPSWCVFFSPSGVRCVLGAADAAAAAAAAAASTAPPSQAPAWCASWSPRSDCRTASIGPTTSAALRAAGMRVDAECSAPTAAALVAALEGVPE